MRSQETSTCFRRSRNRRGVACVEFAVIALPLIVLILGTVDVGQYVNTSQTVTDAAREGCRLASQHATANEADVRTAVLDYLQQCYPHVPQADLDAGLTVTVVGWQLADFDNNPWTYDFPRPSTLALATTGLPVKVQVDFAFNTIRWLHGPGLAQGRVFSSTTTMRRE